jgi:hypothetical protein
MITDKNKFFMQEAFAQAKKALALDEIPVGAVVVLDDTIIGEVLISLFINLIQRPMLKLLQYKKLEKK